MKRTSMKRTLTDRRPGLLAGRAGSAFERLEERRVLAAVSWDGGGDGANWEDGNNWSSNVVPTAADDVTIDVAGTPTIQFTTTTGTRSIRSGIFREAMSFTGGQLNVGTTVALQGGAAVTAEGAVLSGGAWNVTGGVFHVGASGSNRFTGIAFTGELLFDIANGRTRIEGGTTFTTARLSGISTAIGFAPGSTLTGSIIVEGASGTRAVEMNSTSGAVTIAPGGSITLANGSAATLSLGGGFWFGGSMTLTNNGTIANDGAGQTLTLNPTGLTNNGTLRVANGSTMNVATLGGNAGTLTFSGTGNVLDIAAGTYTLNTPVTIAGNTLALGGTVTLASTLTLSSGTFSLDGAWSNTGTITVNGGVLNMGGTFTRAGIGTFVRGGGGTAGAVNITGVLDNSGGTLALTAATGTWVLGGTAGAGTISGGTVTQAGGARLGIGNASNTLVDVAIPGELALTIDNGRTRIHGTTSFGSARLAGSSTALGFAPGSTITSNIVMEGASGTRAVELNGTAGTLTIAPGASISIAPGSGVSGMVGGGFWFGGSTTLANQGTISSDVSGRSMSINAVSTLNTGTIRASAGGSVTVGTLSGNANTLSLSGAGTLAVTNGAYTLNSNLTVSDGVLELGGTWTNAAAFTLAGGRADFNGAWNNTSTVTVNGGVLNMGGTFTRAGIGTFARGGGGTAGTVNITGALNNASGTLALNATTGTWNLGSTAGGGTITGGGVTQSGGAMLAIGPANNLLQDVAITGDLVLAVTNARTRIAGTTSFATARLQGQSTALGFAPGSILTGSIIIEGATGGTRAVEMNGSAGAFTIAPGASIVMAAGLGANGQIGGGFWYGGNMTLTNQGTIANDAAGRTMTLGATTTTNNGTLRATNGSTLDITTLSGNLNTLTMSGASQVDVAGGTYTVNSNVTVPDGTLELSGTWTNAGVLTLTSGVLTLDGAWTNTGTLAVNGGTLNMGGSYTRATIGTFARGGGGAAGTVVLFGTLDNTSNTLALNATTGTWVLGGTPGAGTILGGTVTEAAGAVLGVGNANNLLQGVTVSGELVLLTNSARVRLTNGSTFTTARLQAQSQSIGFEPNTALPGNVIVEATNGTGYLELISGSGTFTIPAGRSVVTTGTAGGGIGGSFWFAGTMTLVNNGTVSHGGTGSFTVGAETVTNAGTMSATGGGNFTIPATTAMTNVNAGVLTGGVWIATGTSTMTFSRVVTTNNANVTFGDSNSFPSITTLSTNNGQLLGRMPTGTGTFVITPAGGTLVNNGTLTIGPGIHLQVSGSFAQSASGSLHIEIRGTAPAQYGRLSTAGAGRTISLDGNITVAYVDGFTPERYDRFEFISGGAVVGRFATRTLPNPLVNGKPVVLYGDQDVTFVASHLADFNSDGTVDFFDYLDFVAAFDAEDGAADFNGDESVDFFDYLDFVFMFDDAQ
jgi:hypothetical protein